MTGFWRRSGKTRALDSRRDSRRYYVTLKVFAKDMYIVCSFLHGIDVTIGYSG